MTDRTGGAIQAPEQGENDQRAVEIVEECIGQPADLQHAGREEYPHDDRDEADRIVEGFEYTVIDVRAGAPRSALQGPDGYPREDVTHPQEASEDRQRGQHFTDGYAIDTLAPDGLHEHPELPERCDFHHLILLHLRRLLDARSGPSR